MATTGSVESATKKPASTKIAGGKKQLKTPAKSSAAASETKPAAAKKPALSKAASKAAVSSEPKAKAPVAKPAAKPAPKKPAAAASKKMAADPPKKSSRKTSVFSPEKRYQMICDAAYFMAEKRGFIGGDPVRDWAVAEAEIDMLIKSGKC
jgi:hypothetical protein